MLLTFLEKEIESCEQVTFSHRMKQTVIQPYFDVALDADCRCCVAFLAPCSTRVGLYTPSGVMKD
jgi:hypothetical protein